ncbi:hypothetical protein [Pseudoduganella albidiflava]|uniref:Phage tail protein n=1 Tax=Pseudoduganella albidiflava TaxID=321983 RepID=A0A411X334_9BURK|nr:hypothetical protein [Pseudoduganella albidiflava]QBI03282.1 hypothetical protein EYF70_22480 [Pseudoduganella albidiflava]GGY68110.1 hypothetical protein GCM10007387_57870 [Pseudoduganella albidiflava]
MRYAIVNYGVVTNVADANEALEPNWVRSDEAQIGWLFDGEAFARPPASLPPPVSEVDGVPMLNLKLILVDDGKMTSAETIINGMEGDDGARARAYWTAAQTARRDNWLVNMMWPQLYASEEEFNDAWQRAAALDP